MHCGGHRTCQVLGQSAYAEESQLRDIDDLDFYRGLISLSEAHTRIGVAQCLEHHQQQQAEMISSETGKRKTRSGANPQPKAAKKQKAKKPEPEVETKEETALPPINFPGVRCSRMCLLHCYQQLPRPGPTPIPTPTPVPVPTPTPTPQPPSPTPGQQPTKVKLPSAYLGDVMVDCIDRGNGYYEMIGYSPVKDPVTGKALVLKVVDAQQVRFDPNNPPALNVIANYPAMVVNNVELKRNSDIIQNLRAKPTMTSQEQEQYATSLAALSAIDAQFNTAMYLRFLFEFCGMTNVNNASINFLISIVNVPKFDNAFFARIMCYGNGQTMFYPLTTVDICGHELSHGLVSQVNGLVYEGHAGAINEAIADNCACFYEHWLYELFNADPDTTNDLRGTWDFTLGEDNARRVKIMRDMKDPHNADSKQPASYREPGYWADPNSQIDFGFVHKLSGVGNKLCYELIQSVGWKLAGQVLFAAWKQLQPRSNYLNYRDALKAAATQFDCLPKMQTVLDGVALTDNAVNDWKG